MRAYCKGGHIIAADVTQSNQSTTVEHLGQRVGVTEGFRTEGGIILLDDKIATSPNSQELVIRASATAGLDVGQRVVVFMGGDDGGISSSGISVFLSYQGEECAVVPERFVWATLKDGEILPRRDVLLVERDDAAMRRYAFNSSPILPPDALLDRGVAAANREDPQASGARSHDTVTLQYARVVRTGPGVKDDQLGRGAIVAFSPQLMCTTLVRQVRNPDGSHTKRYYALVSAGEVFFAVSD